MTKNDIAALFDQWNQALQTGEPKTVAALYHSNAILLPTISNKIRHNHEEIEDYFVHFLNQQPVGNIDESNIRIYDKLAINSGSYTFAFNDGSEVQARFTFVYQWDGESWKIVEHHSSKMPV